MTTSFFVQCNECILRTQDVPILLLLSFITATLSGICVFLYFLLLLVSPKPRVPAPSEKLYTALSEDGLKTQPQSLPCWVDRRSQGNGEEPIEPAELFISVVIPAYNEEDRLIGMLEETVNYLENEYGTISPRAQQIVEEKQDKQSRQRDNGQTNGHANGRAKPATAPERGWEILLVDDGSKDKTLETALDFARTHQLPLRPRRMSGPWTHRAERAVNIPAGSIRLVSLIKNRGKGGAVTHGMRHVRGQYIVFADADGASKFDDLGKLVEACKQVEDSDGRAIAVGSRAHLVGSEAVVKRSKLRNFLMHSFHVLLRLMTPPKTAAIRDTQCGFKLFSRPSLPYIIPYMHSEGWIFDVEMLMLAELAEIPVVEVPIGWREVLGSKLNVIWDSLGMAYGLALLRLCWGFGIYRSSLARRKKL